MSFRRVTSRKDGRSGWRFRVMDPLTGIRIRKTIWIGSKREADQALKNWKNAREAERLGLPRASGWQMHYEELVSRFLAEAPISSSRRRENLQRTLGRNYLGLQVGADLAHVGKLTARCMKLIQDGVVKDHFAVFSLQAPLKQMTRQLASTGLLPYDPLSTWKRLPWRGHQKHRRAFLPDEARAVLAAATELDGLLSRPLPSEIIYRTFLLTGNRPGAILQAKVGDLLDDRIQLPHGTGKKRNGAATLPGPFIGELKAYLVKRGNPDAGEDLFASYRDSKLFRQNLGPDFKRCMILAFVRMNWPQDDPEAERTSPIEVGHLLYTGRKRGFDGPPPKDKKKIEAREAQTRATIRIAGKLQQGLERWLIGRDMYCLRVTHISWARRLVSPDSVRVQVGHAGRDVEERHYLDLVNPHEASQAVYDVLTGGTDLSGKQLRAGRSAHGQAS